MAINSIPQQEVANGNGQMELDLANPITLSKAVANNPGDEKPSGGATFVYVVILIKVLSRKTKKIVLNIKYKVL